MEEVKIHNTMDAMVWAKEFMRINPTIDESTMLAWFANSIMSGWDHAHWKLEPKYQSTLNFCAGLISTMPQFSDKHPEEVRDWILTEVEKLVPQPPKEDAQD